MDEIQSILDYTRKHRLYLTTVLPYIIVRRKEEAERVASEIMEGLESDDPDRVGESARAIRHWVHLASKGFVEGPRREIVDSLVFRVAFRRPAGVQKCIEQLSYLVVDEPESIGENQLKLLVSALPAWQDATLLTGDEGGQAVSRRVIAPSYAFVSVSSPRRWVGGSQVRQSRGRSLS